MSRGIITISENGTVSMPTEEVWMSMDEIADMLGVFSHLVRKVIHTIYKGRELYEHLTSKRIPFGKGIFVDVYDLDVVILVTYRIQTTQGKAFVEYLHKRLYSVHKEKPLYVVIGPNRPSSGSRYN